MSKRKENLYFLAIIPDHQVKEEVMDFKREVAEQFESKAALKSPPHITLHMPFKWRDDREEQLIETLSKFRFDAFPFSTELKNFSFFPPKVVFVDVVKSSPLNQLQKELSTYVRKELNLFNADYKDRAFHPHMTIAFRDLKKSKFKEAEQLYSSKVYSAAFHVNDFCLLKHDGQQWQEFRFFGN